MYRWKACMGTVSCFAPQILKMPRLTSACSRLQHALWQSGYIPSDVTVLVMQAARQATSKMELMLALARVVSSRAGRVSATPDSLDTLAGMPDTCCWTW